MPYSCDYLCSYDNLLKSLQVAYWLLQHKVNVTMAACDTFRSGAVEQLRTHARRLQVFVATFSDIWFLKYEDLLAKFSSWPVVVDDFIEVIYLCLSNL